MKLITKSLALGLVLVGGMAFAAATNPAVVERQALMKSMGGAMKVLGGMAGGKTAFDPATAETARATIADASGQIPAKFEPNETDAESGAKADIWANWPAFLAKAEALNAAAKGMDATTVEGVQTGMAGFTCGECHKAYRN